MTSLAVHRRSPPSGLRPVDPSRDLGAVADLIQSAFAEDLDEAGHAMLRELRTLSRLGPLLWWLDGPGAAAHHMLSGFVWLEEGRIVGNVTVTQATHPVDRWIISNVAVAPSYRQRGIARRLMQAALEMIHDHRGRSVALQVRDDNQAALHVYHTLGFHDLFGTTYLRMDEVLPVHPPHSPGLRLRPFTGADAVAAYRLACEAVDEIAQDEQSVRAASFQVGIEQRVTDWVRRLMGRTPSLRLVVAGDARLDGMITVQPTGHGTESLIALTVHPDVRGKIEAVLISHALYHVSRWSRGPAVARHPTYHPAGVAAFKALGFRSERTLLWMRRDL
jgi:ribosomal protein S18 acetylase RimI-like enzyme